MFAFILEGFRQQALAVSTDPEHKFELALQLEEVSVAYQPALEAEVRRPTVCSCTQLESVAMLAAYSLQLVLFTVLISAQ